MDPELLLLLVLATFAVWLLYVVWQYTKIQSGMSIPQQNRFIFGKFHRVENPNLTFFLVPRAGSALGLFAFLLIILLFGFFAKSFGLIG